MAAAAGHPPVARSALAGGLLGLLGLLDSLLPDAFANQTGVGLAVERGELTGVDPPNTAVVLLFALSRQWPLLKPVLGAFLVSVLVARLLPRDPCANG